METTGVVSSAVLDGKAHLIIGADAITIETDAQTLALRYAEITELKLMDYTVALVTDTETFTLSHLGYDTEPFYQKALAAYNAKVLESLFVSGTPLLETRGQYSFNEEGAVRSGTAVIQLYERCLVILPANLDARRIPLCFTTEIRTGDYKITYALDNGDSYAISKIGYDTEPLEERSLAQLLSLREQALRQVKGIDTSLSLQDAAAAAMLLVEGAAATLGDLKEISESLAAAIEAQIAQSRIADYYRTLADLSDVGMMAFGFREDVAFAQQEEQLEQEGEQGAGDMDTRSAAAPYLIWLMASSRAGGVCAVEFAGAQEDAAATYIYTYSGEWDRFRLRLNHAMEAIGFRREVISLSDEQLRQPGNERFHMAVERNRSLAYIRSCYRGRVVHRSEKSWGKEIATWFSGQPQVI